MTVTDGPYVETKEQIGGLLPFEAQDLDHAVQLMSKHPGLRMGHSRFERSTSHRPAPCKPGQCGSKESGTDGRRWAGHSSRAPPLLPAGGSDGTFSAS